MSNGTAPTILGLGSKVPDGIRENDDAIFAYLNELKKKIDSPFKGYETRRVLAEDENLIDIVKPAAQEALKTAGVSPDEIDLLIGCTSVGKYIVPSDLYELHKELGLSDKALVIPLGNEFTNFNVALVLADALIRVGRAAKILIAIGGHWTRLVDYHTIQAFSAADGAAAAVVGLPPNEHKERLEDWQKWHVVDHETLTVSQNFGLMYLADTIRTYRAHGPVVVRAQGQPPFIEWGEPPNVLWTSPCFHITPDGIKAIRDFGEKVAWKAATNLLTRVGVNSKRVTLVPYQAAIGLIDAWKKNIDPFDTFETIKKYSNMTVANVPVNLVLALSPHKTEERKDVGREGFKIQTPYIVLLSLGPDMHAHAVLLKNAVVSA